MEKNEKILATQQKAIKLIFGSVGLIGFVIFLWGLFTMEEENRGAAGSSATTGLVGMRAAAATLKVHPKIHDQAVEDMMLKKVEGLDQQVRQIKKQLPQGKFMETDETALKATKALQDATRDLLHYRYGKLEPYRVQVDVIFKESNPTYRPDDHKGSFTIELAPSSLQPHSIYTFLEVARHFNDKKGAFHRRAGHVLQAKVHTNIPHLAFQEYSPQYPHKKGTVGYAGRPSGPAFYVSIQDNSRNHGPGSQQAANPHEADSCFGKVVKGFDDVVIQRVREMPGQGFLKPDLQVPMDRMTILVPNPEDPKQYVPWPISGSG